jgi:hypothetical protein
MAAWAAGRARVSGHWAKITVPGHCDCFRTEAVAAPGAAARILPPATGSPAAGEVVPLGQPDSGPPQARVLRRRAGGGFLAAGSLAAMEAQLTRVRPLTWPGCSLRGRTAPRATPPIGTGVPGSGGRPGRGSRCACSRRERACRRPAPIGARLSRRPRSARERRARNYSPHAGMADGVWWVVAREERFDGASSLARPAAGQQGRQHCHFAQPPGRGRPC